MKIDLVVTRHQAFVDYLLKHNMIEPDCQIIKKATPENVKGRNVIGILPLCLTQYCESYTEMRLDLPYKLAGRDLVVDDFEKHFNSMGTYRVFPYDKFKEREELFHNLISYICDSDDEWESFKEYLSEENGDPFEHILFDICSHTGDFTDFSEYVSKYADERHRDRFEAYMDGLNRSNAA